MSLTYLSLFSLSVHFCVCIFIAFYFVKEICGSNDGLQQHTDRLQGEVQGENSKTAGNQ